jgi:hypothetical protein
MKSCGEFGELAMKVATVSPIRRLTLSATQWLETKPPAKPIL